MKNTSQNTHITPKIPPGIDVKGISDSIIEHEFIRRFTLSAGERIGCADDLVLHLRPFFTDPFREQFAVVFLNGRNAVIKTEVLFEGTLTTSAVYPREVVRKVIEYGAAAVLFAHNHPSGNPNPSQDDIIITKKLEEACDTIDVTVHDHIIIAGTEYTSFSDKGLI
jgi:DNA repair protein RadC